MSKLFKSGMISGLLIVFLISSCNLPSKAPADDDPNVVFTQAALTVAAQLNQAGNNFFTPTLPPAQPTNTQITLPTSAPTSTPISSPTPVCDQAAYIKDVNYFDGTVVTPGTTFKKTWRLKNTGTCTWAGYTLIFDNGEEMNAQPDLIPTVAPGQEVDVSVTFTAPSDPKTSVRSYWRVRSPSGVLLPVLGGYQQKSFFIDIKVAYTSSGYDFYTRADSAVWITSAGNISFGGPDSNSDGFAMYKDGQKVEGGSKPNRLLETHPEFVDDGVISGRFPAYTVVHGEHFTAQIGFLALPDGTCGAGNAKFQLNYREGGGPVTNVQSWTETCNNGLTTINVDLTPLAGKTLEFILAVLANGSSSQDWAVWVNPQISIP